MNITFLIGNGFDLSLGMKTKYLDMYDDYVNEISNNPTIEKFKADMQYDSTHKYENWSDFEMGMARYSSQLGSEKELIECIRDFKIFMVTYLKNEEKLFWKKIEHHEISKKYLEKIYNSLEFFYDGLDINTISTIDEIANSPYGRNYNFITFNYTTVFDELIKKSTSYYSKRTVYTYKVPIHIHGTLNRDVVLGIDNVEQMETVEFNLSKKGKRAFVKPFFNDCFDKGRVAAAKKAIEESDLICAFGLSFGDSDKMWIDEIKKWLISDPNHHLIYYVYDEEKYNSCNFDEIFDIEDERKETFLNKIEIEEDDYDTVFLQVHIPVEKRIFNFKDINQSIITVEEQKRQRENGLGVY